MDPYFILKRRMDVINPFKHVICDLNFCTELIEIRPVFSNHETDGITDVVGEFACGNEDGPVLLKMAVSVIRNILRRDHPHAPRILFSFALVDGKDPGPGICGPYGLCMAHSLQRDVIGVDSFSQCLCHGIDAGKGGTEGSIPALEYDFTACPEVVGCHEDCILYLHISGTAADVAPDGLLHFFPGGSGIDIEKGLRAHYHARNAEAALHCSACCKAVRIDQAFTLTESLDRRNLLSLKP